MQESNILDTKNQNNPKKGMNVFLKLFIILLSLIVALSVILFLALATFKYVRGQFDKTGSNSKLVKYTLDNPESLNQVSADLYSKGIITSSFWLKTYFEVRGFSNTINAGVYDINPNSTISEVAEDLRVNINDLTLTIRIEEGSDINDIAQYLAGKTNITKSDLISAEQTATAQYSFFGQTTKPATLEGYLFPDTYYISKNSSASDVITKMLANTDQKITSEMQSEAQSKNMTIQQVLTVASLIEKEIGGVTQRDPLVLQQERQTVAGIIYNRLQKGMALQLDSTKNYTQPGESKADSSYDTYANKGLPPGPIANPSLNAINAALNPINTDYLYFLTAQDGTAYFAKTLAEQDANIAKYLHK